MGESTTNEHPDNKTDGVLVEGNRPLLDLSLEVSILGNKSASAVTIHGVDESRRIYQVHLDAVASRAVGEKLLQFSELIDNVEAARRGEFEKSSETTPYTSVQQAATEGEISIIETDEDEEDVAVLPASSPWVNNLREAVQDE